MKILNESFPARCEVCHQTDLFERAINYCGRCTDFYAKYFRAELAAELIRKDHLKINIWHLAQVSLFHLITGFTVITAAMLSNDNKLLMSHWLVGLVGPCFIIIGLLIVDPGLVYLNNIRKDSRFVALISPLLFTFCAAFVLMLVLFFGYLIFLPGALLLLLLTCWSWFHSAQILVKRQNKIGRTRSIKIK